MKFNVTVDVDWIHEVESLDSELQNRVISTLVTRIEQEFTRDMSKKMAMTADALIRAKTELLINSVLEKPVVISEAFGRKEEYDSIFDMVEQKMTALYTGKLNTSGQCTKDPLLQNIEQHVKNEVTGMLNKMTKEIKTRAKIEAKKAVEDSALITALGEVIKL